MFNFTPVIFKNFSSKKATRLHPKVKRPAFAKARGKIAIEVSECIFCSLCAKKCPAGCIGVDKKKGHWELDPMTCVYCGICVQVCPVDCLSQENYSYYPVRQKFVHEAFKPEGKKLKSTDKPKKDKMNP